MTAGRGFPQPDGVRSGVGVKPTRIPTLVLGGVDPVVRAKNADIVRISTTSDASGSIGMQFGRFDGQRVVVVGLSNGGLATFTPTSLNCALALEWVPDTDGTLSLLWDAKNSVWVETARGGDLSSIHVVIYDDAGNPITTSVSNGVDELSVSDAASVETLSAILKALEKNNELLHKILRSGKN